MKKCPLCAEEIQDDAIKCKHCGELLQKTKRKLFKKSDWVLIILVVLCILWARGRNLQDRGLVPQRIDGYACFQARQYVEENLVSPGTAKFSNCFGESEVKNLGSNNFEVLGWVESENQYGARPRQVYLVNINFKGNSENLSDIHKEGSWTLKDIKFKTFGTN